jgi:hypothetical protein
MPFIKLMAAASVIATAFMAAMFVLTNWMVHELWPNDMAIFMWAGIAALVGLVVEACWHFRYLIATLVAEQLEGIREFNRTHS